MEQVLACPCMAKSHPIAIAATSLVVLHVGIRSINMQCFFALEVFGGFACDMPDDCPLCQLKVCFENQTSPRKTKMEMPASFSVREHIFVYQLLGYDCFFRFFVFVWACVVASNSLKFYVRMISLDMFCFLFCMRWDYWLVSLRCAGGFVPTSCLFCFAYSLRTQSKHGIYLQLLPSQRSELFLLFLSLLSFA